MGQICPFGMIIEAKLCIIMVQGMRSSTIFVRQPKKPISFSQIPQSQYLFIGILRFIVISLGTTIASSKSMPTLNENENENSSYIWQIEYTPPDRILENANIRICLYTFWHEYCMSKLHSPLY